MSTTEIDDRVSRLVQELNYVPGITTFSSCGGHEDRSECCQAPADAFYVDLYLREDRFGWDGLALLLGACDKYHVSSRPGCVFVVPWVDEEMMVCFQVLGENGADPDTLALLVHDQLDRPTASQIRKNLSESDDFYEDEDDLTDSLP